MIVSRLFALAVLAVSLAAPVPGFAVECVPPGAWGAPGPDGLRPVAVTELFGDLARRSVVLLGERHDSAEHHRWQLQVMAALYALRPDMVIGLEMFPRRVQPALDRWVAGELDEQAFLRASDWREVWNTDPQLYLPIFNFARMNRIPMIALNVDRKLTRAVRAKGYDAVPESEREGVGRPAAPSPAYVEHLRKIFGEHQRGGASDEKAHGAPAADDADFNRFLDSQLVWDRAMAQGIASAAKGASKPLVVGVMGGGHIVDRYGVPHQLAALGVTDVAVLLPLDDATECDRIVAGYADAVFGLGDSPAKVETRRQRLGVWLEPDPKEGGVRIQRVERGSVAEAAGILAGDVVIEAAGLPAKRPGDLADAVRRQAPGTWLPLKVKRGAESIEIVAKFPPLTP